MQATQHTDIILRVTLFDEYKQPLYLTGMDVCFALYDGVHLVLEKTLDNGITVTSYGEGEIEVELTSQDLSLPPGSYTAELIVTDPDGRRYLALQEQFVLRTCLTKE